MCMFDNICNKMEKNTTVRAVPGSDKNKFVEKEYKYYTRNLHI